MLFLEIFSKNNIKNSFFQGAMIFSLKISKNDNARLLFLYPLPINFSTADLCSCNPTTLIKRI